MDPVKKQQAQQVALPQLYNKMGAAPPLALFAVPWPVHYGLHPLRAAGFSLQPVVLEHVGK